MLLIWFTRLLQASFIGQITHAKCKHLEEKEVTVRRNTYFTYHSLGTLNELATFEMFYHLT
jgi:hypothetical protein